LAPDLAAATDQIEELRAVPSQLVDRLREAGIFRMFVPKRYGGDALTMAQAMAVIEELAAADAASAWTAMVAIGFNIALSRFPLETVDAIYADGPDVAIRGALAPIGTAVAVDGGYIVNGRWPFASGPYQPKWMVAGCVVIEDGKPRMGPMGPETRLVFVPAEKAEFLDTWYTVGLRGSDSRDYTIKDAFVPEAYAANLFDFSRPQVYGDPLFNFPFPMLAGPTHSAVCLGIARGMLADLAALAPVKRSAFNPSQTLAENPIFQHHFGELAVRHAAIEALTERQTRGVMELAAANAPFDPMLMARNASWVGYVHVQAMDIVNEAFTLASSTPVYSKSRMQQRWRDIRVAAQHFGGSTAQYPVYGGMLAGQMPPMPGS
jgi:alkylation response protein AidB-like acyl-CoA dehydrogenase